MSKNNLIRKSDKKFIRHEKARIRRMFFDAKKQEEMISELYKRFIKSPIVAVAEAVEKPKKAESLKEDKKEKKTTVKKPKAKVTSKAK